MSFGIIYKAENKANGKVYIGQTTKLLEKRINQHCSEAKYHRYNSILHKALNKYGSENFIWEIIENCDSKEELDEMEFHYIMQYNSYKRGYNLTLGGDGVVGVKRSVESKNRLSKLYIGNGNPFYGRKHKYSTIEKMRKAATEKFHSEEYKLSITGKGNSFYNKKHTKETGIKIAESNRNRKWSDESRKKLSTARKLYWAKKRGEE